ncbi:hypothetical protein I4U23_001281 [Adineta vaga]|nr:hypothetical protein I4U23_001281 [Adineta vaga]
MHYLLISLLWILSTVFANPTIRSSSKCSVNSCTNLSINNCISNEVTCFNYQTHDGLTYCAPASSCELLESCDDNHRCTSNTSICIANSCCAQSICLPLVLVELCSPTDSLTTQKIDVYTTATRSSTTEKVVLIEDSETSAELIITTETSSSDENKDDYHDRSTNIRNSSVLNEVVFNLSGKICSTASWNPIGITVASFPSVLVEDFFVNQYDEIYIPDNQNHLIRKYNSNNDGQWIAATSSDFLNDPTAIFVDLDENIYIWDRKNFRVYLWSTKTNSSRIILSFDNCKKSIDFNQICLGTSLFVDTNHSIYLSESSKKYFHANRVMKFEVNSTIGRVIAGTYTTGSESKQLNSPRTIFTNSKGILYVADIDNSRIQRFISGNRNGTTALSIKHLTDFLIDENENYFILIQSKNLIQRIDNNSRENIITNLNQPIRMHFGKDGSIYVLNKGNQTIQKFQIQNNIC